MTWRSHLPDDRSLPPIDDATAESLLTGGEVRPDLEPVAAFLRALRDTARRRVAPSARLAAHVAGGGYARQVPPALWSGVPPLRARPRQLTTTRLVAWASVAGLLAAMLGTATAGFARVLPEPAQQRFESVVRTVTGYDFPEAPHGCGAPDHRPETRDTDTDVAEAAGARVVPDHSGRPDAGTPASDRPAPFGAWVRDLGPGPDRGEVVSARARARAGGAGPGAARPPGAAAQPEGEAAAGPSGKTAAAGPAAAGPARPPVPLSTADRDGPPGPAGGPAGAPAGGGR